MSCRVSFCFRVKVGAERENKLTLVELQKAVSEALADSEKTTIREALDEAAAEVEDRNK